MRRGAEWSRHDRGAAVGGEVGRGGGVGWRCMGRGGGGGGCMGGCVRVMPFLVCTFFLFRVRYDSSVLSCPVLSCYVYSILFYYTPKQTKATQTRSKEKNSINAGCVQYIHTCTLQLQVSSTSLQFYKYTGLRVIIGGIRTHVCICASWFGGSVVRWFGMQYAIGGDRRRHEYYTVSENDVQMYKQAGR